MVALKDILKISIGPRPPKPLSEMTDFALDKVIRINAALRTKYGNFPLSQEFQTADKAYHDASKVKDRRRGLLFP